MSEEQDKMHEARFIGLVLSLQNSAWIALGKIANPLTGKAEKDLQAARSSIDILETLKVKTRGNITEQEEKVISSGLSTLQLNYVEENSRQEAEPTIDGEDTGGQPTPEDEGIKEEGVAEAGEKESASETDKGPPAKE